MGFPRRPSALLRYAIPALLLALGFFVFSGPDFVASGVGQLPGYGGRKHGSGPRHPIDDLIRAADEEFADKLSRSSHTLADAAARYRERRGRHPPPGFDKWFQFAQEKNAVVVEDFWDQIYHDLEPFWALDPARIRKDAREFEMRIEVRDGQATSGSDWFWTQIWLDLIRTIQHLLPDMVIALNAMDEPRLVVPWEDMERYMKLALKTRKMADAKQVVSGFQKLPEHDKDAVTEDKAWEGESTFDIPSLSLSSVLKPCTRTCKANASSALL